IQGSTVSVSAPTPQTQVVTSYTYSSWSDGGTQTHVITAPTTNTTYTATYTGSTPPCSDSFGSVCTDGTTALVAASRNTGIAGDDSFNTINLPFSMPFYGSTYSKIWVDTNGVITFAAPNGSSWDHGAIPSAAAVNKPNLALYPLWEDLVVDASSGIYTQ